MFVRTFFLRVSNFEHILHAFAEWMLSIFPFSEVSSITSVLLSLFFRFQWAMADAVWKLLPQTICKYNIVTIFALHSRWLTYQTISRFSWHYNILCIAFFMSGEFELWICCCCCCCLATLLYGILQYNAECWVRKIYLN